MGREGRPKEYSGPAGAVNVYLTDTNKQYLQALKEKYGLRSASAVLNRLLDRLRNIH